MTWTRSTRPLRTLALVGGAALVVALAGTPAATAYDGQPPVRDVPTPSTGCGLAPTATPGTSIVAHLDSGGVERSYVLHLPEEYDADRPVPLVLAFHGRKGTGAELEEFSGLSTLPAVVAYPDGLPVDGKTAWEGAPYSPPADDVQFVSQLIDALQGSLCIDPDRIYATGKSNGGGFTALLACRMQHRIAAFAPVAGAYYPQSRVGCQPGTPVPMLEFHGVADHLMDYGGGESHGETFPAVMDWLADWIGLDHCRTEDVSSIGPDVTRFAWSGCAGQAEVVHYRVEGAGHTWPGELVDSGPGSATQTISATHVMWDFFLRHPLSGRAG